MSGKAFAVALIVTACGGQVAIDYSDPDADLGFASEGGAPDAAPLGHAGAGCVGYDAAALFAPGPACSQDVDCAGWDAAVWPDGLSSAFLELKACSPEQTCREVFALYEHSGALLACSGADATGDAYCMAYAQQYLTHGKAYARCVPYTDSDGHTDDSKHFCSFGCSGILGACGHIDNQHLFCVTVGSNKECSVPCGGPELDQPGF